MSQFDPNDPFGFAQAAGLTGPPTRRSRGGPVAPPLSHSAPLNMTQTEFLARGLFEDEESYQVYEDAMREYKVDPVDGVFSNLLAGFSQSAEDGIIQLQQIGLGVGIDSWPFNNKAHRRWAILLPSRQRLRLAKWAARPLLCRPWVQLLVVVLVSCLEV